MRLRLRPRFKRPPVEYKVVYHRHLGWALLFFLAAWSFWLPAAQATQNLSNEITDYIMVVIHLVIAARLACVRPWFTWE
jgi:hypothetical protein